MDPVQRALWYIEVHPGDAFSLDEIASACHVSQYHLTRLFAATLGISLMRYARSRRLTIAAKQLICGADEILQVAQAAGYGSTKRSREPSASNSSTHRNKYGPRVISSTFP